MAVRIASLCLTTGHDALAGFMALPFQEACRALHMRACALAATVSHAKGASHPGLLQEALWNVQPPCHEV